MAAQTFGGCATISTAYTDSPAGAVELITRNLRSPEQYLSIQEYMKLKHQTSARDHVKDLQRKLLLPSLYVLRFTADSEIHIMAPRKEPPSRVILALSKAFPADAQGLADTSNLEAEFMAARDISTPGVKGSTEEICLIFNKKAGKYFLYANATPNPRDYTTEAPRYILFHPW